ncbi:MAG: hypothetical protein RL007_1512 [Bacteroidota bacterium]|jgi:hypothetical protein
MNDITDKAITFCRSIGLTVSEHKVRENTFLPGIDIIDGCLIVDRKQLRYPGDILHEAGHIAVSHPDCRHKLNGNVVDSDSDKHGEEMAVLLWSYFAAQSADIPVEMVFHQDGYKGESEWLLSNFREGSYIGMPLLMWMGIAEIDENRNPKILKWLRTN